MFREEIKNQSSLSVVRVLTVCSSSVSYRIVSYRASAPARAIPVRPRLRGARVRANPRASSRPKMRGANQIARPRQCGRWAPDAHAPAEGGAGGGLRHAPVDHAVFHGCRLISRPPGDRTSGSTSSGTPPFFETPPTNPDSNLCWSTAGDVGGVCACAWLSIDDPTDSRVGGGVSSRSITTTRTAG